MQNPTLFMLETSHWPLAQVARRSSSKIRPVLCADVEHEACLRGEEGDTLPRVLVIDHDSARQYQIRLWLKDLCETSVAFTGSLAFHYLVGRKHALVIIQIALSDRSSGQGLLRAIRAIEGYEHIPVIAMVEQDGTENLDDLLKQGFNACILKSVGSQALREMVQRLLRECVAG